MTHIRYGKNMRWEHRLLCFLLAVAAALQLLLNIPAGQVVAEVSNSDSRCSVRQEIRSIPMED